MVRSQPEACHLSNMLLPEWVHGTMFSGVLRFFRTQWIVLFMLFHIYFYNLRFIPYQQFYLVPMWNSTDWLHRMINFRIFYCTHMMCLGQPYLSLVLLPLLWSLNFPKQPVFTFVISPWGSTSVRWYWTAVFLHLIALDDLKFHFVLSYLCLAFIHFGVSRFSLNISVTILSTTAVNTLQYGVP